MLRPNRGFRAEQIFSRAIEFNSRDPNLRVCRAWARVHLGSIEMELRAKSDALLALQVNPGACQIHVSRWRSRGGGVGVLAPLVYRCNSVLSF